MSENIQPRPSMITTWSEFREHWGGSRNFLLGGEITADFEYPLPPLEEVIEAVRAAPNSVVRQGQKSDEFILADFKETFCQMPVEEAIKTCFVLGNFRLSTHLAQPGQIFEDIEERWVEPWRQKLRANRFTFDEVRPIFFASGPNSASNYHMDSTQQLACQRYGTKHFSGLHYPDRLTNPEQRARCELKGMVKPTGITRADEYTIVQPPDSVLWNVVSTPHWVETFDACAMTLTLVHNGLRLDGRLCHRAEEAQRWHADHPAPAEARTY